MAGSTPCSCLASNRGLQGISARLCDLAIFRRFHTADPNRANDFTVMRQRIPDYEGSDLREAFKLISFVVMQPSLGSIADVAQPAFSACRRSKITLLQCCIVMISY